MFFKSEKGKVAGALFFFMLSIIMFCVTDHPRSGWLGFFRYRRENTKAR
jgi:hypothetical protein